LTDDTLSIRDVALQTAGVIRARRSAGTAADSSCKAHSIVIDAHRIDTEHLLLGILRDEGSAAASILAARGIRIGEIRDRIVLIRAEPEPISFESHMGGRLRRPNGRRPDLPRTPGVQIAPTRKGPHGGGETAGDDFWALEGFDIKAALARVFSSDEAHFPEERIELPASFDADERYDFFFVLAPHETSEMRNRLMQEGIERHFRVRIALESRPMNVYVLTAPDGQTPAIRDSEAFGGVGTAARG
jgi:hypothetical protein